MQDETTGVTKIEKNKVIELLFWTMVILFGVALCLGSYLYMF